MSPRRPLRHKAEHMRKFARRPDLKIWPLLAMTVVVLAGCGGTQDAASGGHPGPSHSSSTTSPTIASATTISPTTTTSPPGPLPTGFLATDLTWVNPSDGWALGTAPCTKVPCTSVAHTVDGGKRWSGLPAPIAYLPGDPSSPTIDCSGASAAPCVTGIRFATGAIGYAFGPSSMWMTLDGGHHWTAQPPVAVASLAVDHSSVYRVTYSATGCPPGCTYQLQRSTVGSASWTTVPTPAMTGDAAQLNVDGADLAVTVYQNPAGGAQSEQAAFYRSMDGGSNWVTEAAPCGTHNGTEDDATDTTTSAGGVVVLTCAPRSGAGVGAFVLVSINGGATSDHRWRCRLDDRWQWPPARRRS